MNSHQLKMPKSAHALYALLFLAILLGLSVLLEGCTNRCETTQTYTYYEAVYTTLEDLRRSVRQIAPEPIQAVGKIYLKAPWLFLNQPGKGIHVIDNSDPKNPVVKSFITIPGNNDMAVKGNTLYADSYVDLVLLDISDVGAIHEISRMKDFFSLDYTYSSYLDPARGVVTEWRKREDKQVYISDCDAGIQPGGWFWCGDGIALANEAVFDKSAAITPGNGSVPGVGGSMARFTIAADHLYTLNAGHVHALDIANETTPQPQRSIFVSTDVETIFPYRNNLFIGSQTGMHIVDIATPSSPVKVGIYQHVRVCDPVVVQDTLAFVTLRSGTVCGGFTNQLEVINIKDVRAPGLVKAYPMVNPHGLGIDQSMLFICDGEAGLKIYNASDIHAIDENPLAHYAGMHAYDVIPRGNVVMMIGQDGIFQYDYSDPENIKFLSKLSIDAE